MQPNVTLAAKLIYLVLDQPSRRAALINIANWPLAGMESLNLEPKVNLILGWILISLHFLCTRAKNNLKNNFYLLFAITLQRKCWKNYIFHIYLLF